MRLSAGHSPAWALKPVAATKAAAATARSKPLLIEVDIFVSSLFRRGLGVSRSDRMMKCDELGRKCRIALIAIARRYSSRLQILISLPN